MWEYKHEYVAIFCGFDDEGNDLWDALIPPEKRGNRPTCDYGWQVSLLDQLDRLGTDGWEVVSIPEGLVQGEAAGGFVLLKRLKRGGA